MTLEQAKALGKVWMRAAEKRGKALRERDATIETLQAGLEKVRAERDAHESRADGWQSLGADIAVLLGDKGLVTAGQVYHAVREVKEGRDAMQAVVEAARRARCEDLPAPDSCVEQGWETSLCSSCSIVAALRALDAGGGS